jgi:hypothetical protein
MTETYTLEEESIIDVGEHVVRLGRIDARGKGSGRAFVRHADALEAVGLAE